MCIYKYRTIYNQKSCIIYLNLSIIDLIFRKACDYHKIT